MRILFIGDSIIRGKVGVDWVSDLSGASPEWSIVNAGVDGDTLLKINERLKRLLHGDGRFDYIVFCGGANDILIPHFSSRGKLFRMAQRHLLKKGYAPCISLAEFHRAYQHTIGLIRQHSTARIVLMTMGVLNESPDFILNAQRTEVNQLIRELALQHKCLLADPGQRVDAYLRNKSGRNFLIEGFFDTAWLDRWQCRFFRRADSLSEERGLSVTIDGIHLNSIGAAIFRDEVEKQLRSSVIKVPATV